MTLQSLLLEQHNIDARLPKNPKPGTAQADCPKSYCKQHRDPNDRTPLKIEILSSSHAKFKCSHCLFAGEVGQAPKAEEVQAPIPKIPNQLPKKSGELPAEILQYFDELKVAREIIEARKICWLDDRSSIGFPYHHAGERTNMMLMQLPDKTTRLASSKHIGFYGIERVTEGQEIIIAQNELSALMLETCGFPNVIALPNGGKLPPRDPDGYEERQDPYEYFAAAADLMQKAKKIVIALDNTEAGDKVRHEIARRVGAAKCWNVKYTRNTVAQTLLEHGIDMVCEDVNLATPHPIRGLYTVTDFEAQLLTYFNGGMSSGLGTGWANVDELYTVVPGQLTVVTGIPNSGKSEWVDALTMNLALTHGWRFGVFSPENGKEPHATKLIEKRVEAPSDPRNPQRMSELTFISGASWVNQHYFFIVSDVMDAPPTLDWILEKAQDAVLRYGIKGLIIDPWNRIQKNLGSKNETDYVAEALAQILRFCANHDVHVWLVAHPSKQEPDKKTGVYPVPSLYSIAGSAHFVNMCDNGIVIHRAAGADNKTEVWVKKVRFKHVGTTGHTDLFYNIETGRYASEGAPNYSMYNGEPIPSADGDMKVWEVPNG